ncbi:YkgJ family cysteine cluster protein [Hydrogenophaga sp.]|jgi:hypothetical protein|uniref:YkgJ family cysteine cluster protein n=1 Tax=Hydrogenophaga sp. TaxID=1904254 RepID=UPI0027377086|nr:YkgJ family cysteine cluster protein [Hydrogenophaga sp.]MDP1958995.1 YkgJ family cysteine cluster protein [Methylotenera sp.]MDP3885447.1 YkgJ family cysteine cluster protein [Hydrogenophaga sp.]
MTKNLTASAVKNEELTLELSRESASIRRSNFIKAIPPALSELEDNIQAKLAKENASIRSKLRKIYNLMSDIGSVAEPYVACAKGCSSCCKMNVKISQFEANLIGEKTGLNVKQLSISKNHNSEEFIGIPCMFLKDNSCSIYDVRPFVCRNHVWFDTSSYWCDPERSLKVTMPMIEFSGAVAAFLDVTKKDSGGIHADIRDFFS